MEFALGSNILDFYVEIGLDPCLRRISGRCASANAYDLASMLPPQRDDRCPRQTTLVLFRSCLTDIGVEMRYISRLLR